MIKNIIGQIYRGVKRYIKGVLVSGTFSKGIYIGLKIVIRVNMEVERMKMQNVKRYKARKFSTVDGDTAKLIVDGELIIVRLAGIDAPEDGQPYALMAKYELDGLLSLGELVVEQIGIDKYGRAIVFIWNGKGEEINKRMIERGLAFYMKGNGNYIDLIEKEQIAARAGIGVWSCKNYIKPWIYRKRKNKG